MLRLWAFEPFAIGFQEGRELGVQIDSLFKVSCGCGAIAGSLVDEGAHQIGARVIREQRDE